jgi:hypothetical protein
MEHHVGAEWLRAYRPLILGLLLGFYPQRLLGCCHQFILLPLEAGLYPKVIHLKEGNLPRVIRRRERKRRKAIRHKASREQRTETQQIAIGDLEIALGLTSAGRRQPWLDCQVSVFY